MLFINHRTMHVACHQIHRSRHGFIRPTSFFSTSSHTIISRRAVNQYLKKNKDHPLNSFKKKPKPDETPWPRSLQMVGYGAMILAVPFCIGAAIVEIPSFRRFLQGGDEDEIAVHTKPSLGSLCVNAIRDFWGVEEFMPDEEQKWLLQQAEKTSNRSFENEDPIHIREMQKEVGKISHSSQRIKVMTYPVTPGEAFAYGSQSSSESSSTETVISDGKMTMEDGMNENSRHHIMSKLGSAIDSNDGKTPIVAIEFLDEDEKEQVFIQPDEFGSVHTLKAEDFCDDLRVKTSTWSSWQYFPNASSASSSPSDSKTRLSNDEIRKSELEWKLQQVKQQLTDPNCLRDIDEMQDELKSIEKELRRTKRKWIIF